MKIKYFTLIEKLTKIFKKKCYFVPEIILGLCTVDNGHLTFFYADEFFHSAKTIDDIMFYVKYQCNCYDFAITKAFISAIGCSEAMILVDIYTKEIESKAILESDFIKSEYEKMMIEAHKLEKKFAELEIILREEDELFIKNYSAIIETLCKCFGLPEACILLRNVVKGHIICRISFEVKKYLMELKLVARELEPLCKLRISYLINDDNMTLTVPLDCDTEVNIVD